MPDLPALRLVDPCLLHIPNKDWAKDDKEKQNYDELERWSFRLEKCGARGEIAYGETATSLTYDDALVHTFVGIPDVHFVGGRKYRLTGMWSGLSTAVQNNDIELLIYVGGMLFRNCFQCITGPPGRISLGGTITGRYLPTQDQTQSVSLSSQRPTGSTQTGALTVYANTAQSLGQLLVEDIGPQGAY